MARELPRSKRLGKKNKPNEQKPFDQFQLEEYKNISTSHYESVKQVSVFFRYYLLILAAPVFILTLIASKDEGLRPFLEGREGFVYYNIVCSYFVVVGIIGFLIFLYVVNLRHDAILYARAVNRVRRYFYEQSDLDIADYEKYVTLPITSSRPKYSEKTFFLPLVLVFSLINCAFVGAGLFLKRINSPFIFDRWILPFDVPINVWTICGFLIAFAALHAISFGVLSRKRDNTYLRYYAFGIDIDGVLNNQTEHFVKYLDKLTGKKIDPRRIKEIPVSLNTELGISDFEEKIVFNTKEYWTELEVKPKAVKRINDFQKRFGLRIAFFSYRDWPQYPDEDKSKIRKAIRSKNLTPLDDGDLRRITADWLETHKFLNEREAKLMTGKFLSRFWYRIVSYVRGYKRVVLESGNPNISDTRFSNYYRRDILNRNRFQSSKLHGFRFFVEDFPENAIKLSSLCDYVFMFDEPYNAEHNYNFPKNVIRVKTWDDIYHLLKTLS